METKTSEPGSRQKHGVWKLVKDFTDVTSLHGFHHALRDRPRYNKYRWKNCIFLAAILVCLTWANYNLYVLITEYRQYPVTTSIVVERKDELELPAITICNCNRVPRPEYWTDVNKTVSRRISTMFN